MIKTDKARPWESLGAGIIDANGQTIFNEIQDDDLRKLIVAAVNAYDPRKDETLKALVQAAKSARFVARCIPYLDDLDDPDCIGCRARRQLDEAISLASGVMGGQTENGQ